MTTRGMIVSGEAFVRLIQILDNAAHRMQADDECLGRPIESEELHAVRDTLNHWTEPKNDWRVYMLDGERLGWIVRDLHADLGERIAEWNRRNRQASSGPDAPVVRNESGRLERGQKRGPKKS